MAEDNKEFSEVLNNVKFLTLGQLFQIIKKLKYTTVIWLFTLFSSCLGGAYVAGQYEEQKETGVALESPFAMRLKVDENQYDFSRLVLIEDPMVAEISEGKIVLSIREIKNEFDIIPVGKIVATVDKKELKGVWKWILSDASQIELISVAHAQYPTPVFNWNGHKGDYKFKEEFVKEYLVYRYYSDGCVLSYEVDENRRSIPGTFEWVERTH